MRKKGKRPFGKILMILMLVFFYLPILYMIIFSFNDGKSRSEEHTSELQSHAY